MSRIALLACVLLACGGAAPKVNETIKLAAGTATLKATVTGVKVHTGTVYCALFNAPDGFPGSSPIIGGNLREDPLADSVTCEFAALPAGTYAVIVFQDENSDGKLDTNAFGAPTEGYGVTNNIVPAASAPTYSDSSVALAEAATVETTITLKH
jgi:uncharacterized protein (DUF2141 family)